MSQIISKIKYDLLVVSFSLCFVRHPVFPWYFINFIKLSIYLPVLTRNPYTALATLNQSGTETYYELTKLSFEKNLFFSVFTFILHSFSFLIFSLLFIFLFLHLCSPLLLLYFVFLTFFYFNKSFSSLFIIFIFPLILFSL